MTGLVAGSSKLDTISTVKKIDIHNLSSSERILLAEELWDSVIANEDFLEVTEAQKKVLEERLEAYKASPKEGSS